ncbi:CU044_2847 family protein [Streptomyces sp. NPDC056244]|uniref:CU044_2847 family protein n=1 Tax=Streptomyces sp. NPDC056244 TaxID=3345762 RepID=UPI0035DF8D95
MTALMEFTTDSGATVLVEVERDAPGARPVGRGGNSLAQAGRTFDEALQGIRTAAESALAVFRDGALQPDGVELEFGVKLVAEAGAVIAKTSAEGHMTVKLSWNPGASGAAGTDPGATGTNAGATRADPGATGTDAGAQPETAGQHPGTAGPAEPHPDVAAQRPGTARQ